MKYIFIYNAEKIYLALIKLFLFIQLYFYFWVFINIFFYLAILSRYSPTLFLKV